MIKYNYIEEEQIVEAKFYGKINIIEWISHLNTLLKLLNSWDDKSIIEDYSSAEIISTIEDLKYFVKCINSVQFYNKKIAIAWLCTSPLSSAKLYLLSKLLPQKNKARLFSTKSAALVWLNSQKKESYIFKKRLNSENIKLYIENYRIAISEYCPLYVSHLDNSSKQRVYFFILKSYLVDENIKIESFNTEENAYEWLMILESKFKK